MRDTFEKNGKMNGFQLGKLKSFEFIRISEVTGQGYFSRSAHFKWQEKLQSLDKKI